jgi:asparagine synthase (glutamine-hydrolysing)
MCGIAGFVELAGSTPPDRSVLERMARVLQHRGPDDEGFAVIGCAGLAHRRLSIIDLSGGHQPMASDGDAVSVIFNGEIYNFLEVRAELEAAGHSFRTRSDTEVLLQAYRTWGVDALPRLNGMFAFAIWDAPRRRLFAARDRLGKKPFYYAHTHDRFVFGSEIKALLAVSGVGRDIDLAALDEFLSQMCIGGERSIFRGIRKLPPAHWLMLEDGKLTVGRYWNLVFGATGAARSEEEYLDGLEQHLRRAVERRLISDVPLGAFLSGGVDSSAIVAMMARASSRPVRTFTIGFEEKGYSEIEDARIVSRHLGTEHREYVVKPEAVAILPELVWHYDEPFGDSSAIPTYYVCQMARREVTVALSGDGGDELFAGYMRYRWALSRRKWNLLPGFIRSRFLAPLAAALPLEWPGRNRLHAMAHHSTAAPGYGLGIYPYVKNWLYTPDMRAALAGMGARGEAIPLTEEILSLDVLSRLQYLDTTHYLPDDILAKVDRASMAHSLEVRAPLLDYELVEYMATIPASLKLRGGTAKYLFKRLLARLLPESVFSKPKQGFAVPKGAWFRNELRRAARERLLDGRTLRRGYFRREAIEELLGNHEAGRRDYSDWIWCLLVLEEWHRTFCDQDTRRI